MVLLNLIIKSSRGIYVAISYKNLLLIFLKGGAETLDSFNDGYVRCILKSHSLYKLQQKKG